MELFVNDFAEFKNVTPVKIFTSQHTQIKCWFTMKRERERFVAVDADIPPRVEPLQCYAQVHPPLRHWLLSYPVTGNYWALL